MRIAVLGDIHANLQALETALAEARKAGCDRIYHAGDLVGYGPRPNETIRKIIEEDISGPRGDFDEYEAWGSETPGCFHPRSERASPRGRPGALGGQKLGYLEVNHLKDLPFSIDFEADGKKISIFHSGPTDLYEALDEATSDARLREIIGDAPADVYISGNTHRPAHRVLDGRHFINAGSVGLPWDGDPRGCLALVDLSATARVTFMRFVIGAAVEAAVAVV